MFFTDTNTMPIQEKYIGKDKDTLEIESLFQKIKEVYRPTAPDAAVKLFKNLGEVASRKFGFKEINFWITNADNIDAFTFIKNDEVNNLLLSPRVAYKFDTKTYIAIVSFSKGAILRLNAGELTAVFLHEIGHHFSRKVVLLNLSDGLSINNKALEELRKSEAVVDFDDPSQQSAFYKLMKGTLYYLKELWFDILYIFGQVVDLRFSHLYPHMIFQIIYRVFEGLINKLYPFKTYTRTYNQEEILADSFATVHGYGPELVSAVSVIEEESLENVLQNKSKFMDFLYTWLAYNYIGIILPIDSLMNPIQSSHRANAQIDVLYRELEDIDTTDKKSRDKILNDIDTLKKMYEARLSHNGQKIARWRWTYQYNRFVWCMHMWNAGYNVPIDFEKLKKVFG